MPRLKQPKLIDSNNNHGSGQTRQFYDTADAVDDDATDDDMISDDDNQPLAQHYSDQLDESNETNETED